MEKVSNIEIIFERRVACFLILLEGRRLFGSFFNLKESLCRYIFGESKIFSKNAMACELHVNFNKHYGTFLESRLSNISQKLTEVIVYIHQKHRKTNIYIMSFCE